METYAHYMYIVIILLVPTANAITTEPECTCSKFSYEESLLEKMIRTEIKFDDLQKLVQSALTGMERTIADLTVETKESLQTFGESSEQLMERNKSEWNKQIERIDNGLAKIPDKPSVAFRSKKVADLTLDADQIIVFTENTFNLGGGYDNTTGIFTAPVSGQYIFTVQLCPHGNQNMHYGIVVEGVDVTRGYFKSVQTICMSFDAVVDVKASGKVWVKSRYANDQLFEDEWRWNIFAGVFIN